MGNLRACFAVATLALAACGSDHATPDASIKLIDAPPVDMKIWEDAPPPSYDFACTANPEPTAATATVTLSGTAQEIGFDLQTFQVTVTPLDGATVDACNAQAADCNGAQNQYGTTLTDTAGAFALDPIDTNMMPLDAYLLLAKANSRTLYTYPPQPFVADQGSIPMLSFAPSLIGLLSQLPSGGCTQDDDANGILVLALVDCANQPIGDSQNVTLSVKQNNTEVQGTTVINLGDLQQQAAGTYVVCNVPENATTTVGATYNTTAFRAHDVQVVKGTTTATIVRPGY